jgi:hypothetical protein
MMAPQEDFSAVDKPQLKERIIEAVKKYRTSVSRLYQT